MNHTAQDTYWHFIPDDGHLSHDLRDVKAYVGMNVRRAEQDPVLCEYGLHASARALDALHYAPGTVACLVTLGGKIVHDHTHSDKVVAQSRTIVAMGDVAQELHEFALWCAERALAHVSNPVVLRDALDAKRAWLRGEIGDGALGAIADAVWEIAHSRNASDLLKFVAYSVYYAADRMPQMSAIYASSYARAAAVAASGGEAGDTEDALHYDQLDDMLRAALGATAPEPDDEDEDDEDRRDPTWDEGDDDDRILLEAMQRRAERGETGG